MSPKCSAKVLSSVPKHKKGCDVFYREKCVLDKLHAAMSYSAVGCEFSVNESTTYVK